MDFDTAKQTTLIDLFNEKAFKAFEELVADLASTLKKPLLRTKTTVACSTIFKTTEDHAVLFIWPQKEWLTVSPKTRTDYLNKIISEKFIAADLVWLVEDKETKLANCFDSWNEHSNPPGIKDYSLKEWFSSYFSQVEYSQLIYALSNTKAKCQYALGFSTVALPTPIELSIFKEKLISEYLEHGIASIEKRLGNYCQDKGINVSLEKIEENILLDRRYLRLFNNTTFGDSLAASEWRLRNNKITENTEQTGTVVGYFKAVEQLMWEILSQHVGRGLYVQFGKEGTRSLLDKEFLEKNEKYATLGNLMYLFSNFKYCSFYEEIYDDPGPCSQLLSHKLKNFLDTRNGKQHKTNFSDLKVVENIRNETFDITFLLLGSLKSDSFLGTTPDIDINRKDFLEESFQWMSLQLDNYLSSIEVHDFVIITALAFPVTNEGKVCYSLALDANNAPRSEGFYLNTELFKNEHDSEEAIHWLFNRYLEASRFSAILKDHLKYFFITLPESNTIKKIEYHGGCEVLRSMIN